MIRPITLICWLLALGSGLYLYRAKHEVELMDKHIERIARETSDIRTESRNMLDEWIRLGEPEQLRKYSDQYLGLKAIEPNQFVRLTDLPNRLPDPRAAPVEPPADAVADLNAGTVPVASTLAASTQAQPAGPSTDVEDTAGIDLPVPPIPPTVPGLTLVSEPVAIPLQARPVTPRPPVQTDAGAQRPRVPDDAKIAAEPRPVAPKPVPAAEAEPRAVVSAEPHQAAPAEQRPARVSEQITRPAQPRTPEQPRNQEPAQWTSRGLPPLQAQGQPAQTQQWASQAPAVARAETPRPLPVAQGVTSSALTPSGLPPLQAQSETGRRPPVRTAGPGYEPRMEVRPLPVAEQAPIARPAAPAYGQAPTQSGSLLGGARGAVPLPVPAPMPVNAIWPNPGR